MFFQKLFATLKAQAFSILCSVLSGIKNVTGPKSVCICLAFALIPRPISVPHTHTGHTHIHTYRNVAAEFHSQPSAAATTTTSCHGVWDFSMCKTTCRCVVVAVATETRPTGLAGIAFEPGKTIF